MNGEKDFDFANFIDTNCINAIDTNGFYSNCATSNGTITIIVSADGRIYKTTSASAAGKKDEVGRGVVETKVFQL